MDSNATTSKKGASKTKSKKIVKAKSTFTSFSDEGALHFRAGHFRKALFCFDRALELKPGHRGALVARSQCHLKLGDAKSALRDAEASFEEGNTSGNIMGFYWYAESLFALGQFENALMAYHRGYRLRRDKEEFRIGIAKAQESIKRAVGDKQGTQIEDFDEVLPKIEAMQDSHDHEKCCILDSLNLKVTAEPVSKKQKLLIQARDLWVDREVLGDLHHDKVYLTQFLKRPDIKGDSQSTSSILRANANEALRYLNIREDFWRQSFPMYSRKVGLNWNGNMVRQYEKEEHERMEASLRIKTDAAQGAVLKNLGQIQHALQIGRFTDCKLESDRAIRQMKEINQRLIPRKPEFITEILHLKGLACMKLKDYDSAVATFQEEFKMAAENKMTHIKSRALDFVGRSFAMKGSFAESAETWDSRLAIAKTPVERAYLFHEIGRSYYESLKFLVNDFAELHKYDLATIYGKQSYDEAFKVQDDVWAMNAQILLGQVDVKKKRYEDASAHFERAEEHAMKCGNKVNIKLLHEAQNCIRVYLEKKDEQQKESALDSKITSEDSMESFVS